MTIRQVDQPASQHPTIPFFLIPMEEMPPSPNLFSHMPKYVQLHSVSIVSCSAVNATGVFRQSEARTLLRCAVASKLSRFLSHSELFPRLNSVSRAQMLRTLLHCPNLRGENYFFLTRMCCLRGHPVPLRSAARNFCDRSVVGLRAACLSY